MKMLGRPTREYPLLTLLPKAKCRTIVQHQGKGRAIIPPSHFGMGQDLLIECKRPLQIADLNMQLDDSHKKNRDQGPGSITMYPSV